MSAGMITSCAYTLNQVAESAAASTRENMQDLRMLRMPSEWALCITVNEQVRVRAPSVAINRDRPSVWMVYVGHKERGGQAELDGNGDHKVE